MQQVSPLPSLHINLLISRDSGGFIQAFLYSASTPLMDMTSASRSHSPFLPSLPQQKLFILTSLYPDSQWKKTFHSAAAAPVSFFHRADLQTRAVRETNPTCIRACREKTHTHTTRRPFIPHGPPNGCLMRWPFVGETIFTSETQNGFINSIRGWHFPHPHAGPENQCFPLEEYCSPHLSLSLCWQHMHDLHTQIQDLCLFPAAPLGCHTFSSDSVQPLSDKPIVVKDVSIWTHSHMGCQTEGNWPLPRWILLQQCKQQ